MQRLLVFGFVIWLCAGLGVALSGEQELMALRGGAEGEKPRVNEFQAHWRDAFMAGLAKAAAPEMASGMEVETRDSYMPWKNSCVFVPPVVAGKQLEANGGGFGQVAPYVDKGAAPGSGFMDLLAEQLSGP